LKFNKIKRTTVVVLR